MTAKNIIMKYLWLHGGGYFKEAGNLYFLTKASLQDLDIRLDTRNIHIQEQRYKNKNYIKISGLITYKDRVRFIRVLDKILYDGTLYKVEDYKTYKGSFGKGVDIEVYDIILSSC